MKPSANFALLCAICLASCQKPPTAEQVFQDKVEASVRETLRDPTSATFDNWTLNQKENVACAQVNAKNGYGGYTGKEWFVYDNGLVHHADYKKKSRFSESFDKCMSISMARSEQKRRDAEAEIEKICRENKGAC